MQNRLNQIVDIISKRKAISGRKEVRRATIHHILEDRLGVRVPGGSFQHYMKVLCEQELVERVRVKDKGAAVFYS